VARLNRKAPLSITCFHYLESEILNVQLGAPYFRGLEGRPIRSRVWGLYKVIQNRAANRVAIIFNWPAGIDRRTRFKRLQSTGLYTAYGPIGLRPRCTPDSPCTLFATALLQRAKLGQGAGSARHRHYFDLGLRLLADFSRTSCGLLAVLLIKR
jgi:hypothetical protein